MAEGNHLAELFLRRHPQEAAALLESHEPESVAALVRELEDDLAVELMAALSAPMASACAAHLADDVVVRCLGAMPRRRAAGLLRRLPNERRAGLLHGLSAATRVQLEMMLLQPAHRVSAWMNAHPLAFPEETTVDAARRRLRRGEEPVAEFYVVDAEERLIGVAPVSALFTAVGSAPLESIAAAPAGVLRGGATVESALESRAWTDADTLPVVDRNGRLIGSVRHAELRRAVVQSAQRAAAEGGGDYLNLANDLYVGLAEILALSIARQTQAGAPDVAQGETRP
jgi:Mg/Co/Ni transporter MgtE